MIAIMFTSTPLKQVTKYQAIEDVTCMLQGTDLAPLELSDTDLSVYSWYRDEEPSYPSEAPYENVRLLHDVGMAHYSKSGFKWEVSYKKLYTWRSAKTKRHLKAALINMRLQALESKVVHPYGAQSRNSWGRLLLRPAL